MCLYEATSVVCRIFLIDYLLLTSLNSAGKIITINRTDGHLASCLSKKEPHILYETLHWHQSIGETTICISSLQPLQGLTLFISVPSERLVDYFAFPS